MMLIVIRQGWLYKAFLIIVTNIQIRDHSESGLSQWETTLLCSGVSHWMGPYTEWSLPEWKMFTTGQPNHIDLKLFIIWFYGVINNSLACPYLLQSYVCGGTFKLTTKNVSSSEYAHDAFRWRHSERDGVSNQRRLGCVLNHLFGFWSKKTSKLRVTGVCEGYSPGTAQRISNVENVSIWWRHHGL